MTKSIKILFFLFCCMAGFSKVNAQWLKKQVNSDYLYDEAKKALDRKDFAAAADYCRQAMKVAPKNIDLHLLLGRIYSQAGKTDSARDELKYVIEKNPQYRDAHIYVINLELGKCNYPEALTRTDIALYYFPEDTLFRVKKMEILNLIGNRYDADKISEDLLNENPYNAYMVRSFVEQHLQSGRVYSRKGFLIKAKREYEAALEQDPANKEALEAIYNLDVRSGNFESSLIYVNRALQNNPTSYKFLFKKVGILQEMLRYTEAIAVLQKMMKLFPGDGKVQQTNMDLRMESGRYYMNTDPYLQFQAVLEKQPNNREALNYVINLAYSRGLHNEALTWVNKGIKNSPNDDDLLNKKIGILESLKNFTQAAELEEKQWRKHPNSAGEKEHFLELKLLSGKQFMTDLQYDSAMIQFQDVLQYEPANMDALNYAINLYTAQKNYDEALHAIDQALQRNPGNEQFLFKKIGVLEAYGRNTEAADEAKNLLSRHSNSKRYAVAYIDASMAAGREYMQVQDYDNAIMVIKGVLKQQPDNVDALNYIINIESAVQKYDSAMYYANLALHYYPGSKDFLYRKSVVFADKKEYENAYAISGMLYEKYPYNIRFKQGYLEHLLSSGRAYAARESPDTALIEYSKVLAISPVDTNALYYTINILNDQKRFDSALVFIQHGRKIYPANPYFILKKAVVYENMQLWDSAALAADTLMKMTPNDRNNVDYASYLQSKILKNEVSIFFLHSKYNYQAEPSNIGTFQYLRFLNRNKGNIAFRVNYAGRPQGTGLQFELETYLNHSTKTYSYAAGAYSADNKIFPQLRLAYSLFHNFNKGWEAELGARFLKSDTINSFSGVGSLAKYLGDFWLNLRSYVSQYQSDLYGSGILTARYYFNNKTDYFSAFSGYGVVPDDRSLNYQISNLIHFKTVSVGAGFQKNIKYKTIVGLTASWINQQVDPTTYRNQYDIYVTLKRRF